MVRASVDVLELLRKQASGADLDFLREAVAVLAEAVMDHEVSAQVGPGYGERSEMRTTRRNGYRPRHWDTRVGSIDLQIPRLRQGSYFPALLEPRRRSGRALLAVVQQAYVEGVSTRRVDDLVRSLGCEGISKSQVSRICSELDTVRANGSRTRGPERSGRLVPDPLAGEHWHELRRLRPPKEDRAPAGSFGRAMH